jgi:hypothetical protein
MPPGSRIGCNGSTRSLPTATGGRSVARRSWVGSRPHENRWPKPRPRSTRSGLSWTSQAPSTPREKSAQISEASNPEPQPRLCRRRRWSRRALILSGLRRVLTAPSGAAVQGRQDVAQGCGEGGKVPVIDRPGVDVFGELGWNDAAQSWFRTRQGSTNLTDSLSGNSWAPQLNVAGLYCGTPHTA